MRAFHVAIGGASLLAAILLMASQAEPTATSQAPRQDLVAPKAMARALATPDAAVAPGASTEDASEQTTFVGSYRTNERMMKFASDVEAAELASQHGAKLLRAPGRSGYALVSGSKASLDALAENPAVSSSLPHASTRGAENNRRRTQPLEDYQWYIDEVDPPLLGHSHSQYFAYIHPVESITVAILDTGVAYGSNMPAGLATSPIVAPYDFVNDDTEAYDDHQHGTHLASLIASDGVNGAIEGITAGVGLMPVKVLDQNNEGIEIDLIEGIHHAVANGADVINMSLSFGEGYQPSRALQEALQSAHDAGIVMVGAAGNDGADYITWPAASPLVIAVGASAKDAGFDRYERRGPAGYTNLGSGMDLMTSGGDLSRSGLASGLPNGILAEAISPHNPDQVGHWLMAGTSQAAAIVSALSAGMIAADVAPDRVLSALQAHCHSRGHRYLRGEGRGYLDMHWGWNLDPTEYRNPLPADGQRYPTLEEFHVALLPHFKRASATELRAAARVTVFNADGETQRNVRVLANLYGSDQGIVSCWTNSKGQCTLEGNAYPEFDAHGEPLPHAVAFSVETIVNGLHAHPRVAMTDSEGFELLVSALRSDEQTANALLSWSFERGNDPDLGNLAPSFSVVNSGSGLASIPLGIAMSPSLLQRMGTVRDHTIVASGHDVHMKLVDLDGSGLASIPLGFTKLRLVNFQANGLFDGSGLASLPLDFKAFDAYGNGDKLLRLDRPMAGVTDSAVAAQLAEGGWSTNGYGAASILGSSSTLAITPTFVAGLDGLGAGATPLPIELEPTAQ